MVCVAGSSSQARCYRERAEKGAKVLFHHIILLPLGRPSPPASPRVLIHHIYQSNGVTAHGRVLSGTFRAGVSPSLGFTTSRGELSSFHVPTESLC